MIKYIVLSWITFVVFNYKQQWSKVLVSTAVLCSRSAVSVKGYAPLPCLSNRLQVSESLGGLQKADEGW